MPIKLMPHPKTKEFSVNPEKAINSMLYICDKQGGSCDKYNLLKIIFFADSKHLFLYGRPITGDSMIGMEFGPVPSFCFDQLKPKIGGEKLFEINEKEGSIVKASKKPDLDVFSESDIDCLDESIAENASLSFAALRNKSHTAAYNKTQQEKGKNRPISFLDIAKEDGHVSDDMLNYIKSRFQY